MWEVKYIIKMKSRLLHSEETIKDVLPVALGDDSILIEDCELIIIDEWSKT